MSVKILKRKFPSGKRWLYLDISHSSTRKKEALRLALTGDRLQDRETLKMADEIRARREIELLQSMHGVIHPAKRKESFVAYAERIVESKVSRSTRQSYRDSLKHFVDFKGDWVSFGGLTRRFMEDFRAHLLTKVSQNSAQIYFSRIKAILHQAVREGMIASNPAQGISVQKQERLPIFLTIEEIQELARTPCANQHVRAAFLFSCFTGLRYSDLKTLSWENIQGENLVFTQSKTRSPLRVPLSEQGQRILREIQNTPVSSRLKTSMDQNLIFRLPAQPTIDKELKQWGRTAKLTKVLSMHKARHTFATLSLSSGIDIYTTSKLLGHKNLQNTQIYAQVIDQKKKEAVLKLPTIGNV